MSEQVFDLARKGIRHAFNSFDSDKSGFIQRHQLGLILKKLTEAFNVEDPSQQDVQEVLKQLDVNGDGKISQGQFQALVQQVMIIMKQEQAKKN